MFEETHKLALALVRDGTVDGLRIDHPDGLADPAGYLRRLREHGARHVWVEKILDPGEQLRDWPVDGHGRLRVPQRRRGAVRRPGGRGAADRAVGGDRRRPAAVRRLRRRGEARAGGDDVRARAGAAGARGARARSAGWSARVSSLPVYRTYVEPWSGRVTDEDREAVAEAGLPESLADVLLLRERGWDAFVTRFQQTTPPIMAKGVEDTAFYRYGRLLALNDVGGDPAGSASRSRTSTRPTGCAPSASRATCSSPRRTTPSAPATCGRGSARWRRCRRSGLRPCARWLDLTAESGPRAPDAVERYFVFQTLVGAWPLEAERLRGVHGEGAARGQAHDELGRARRGARGSGDGRSAARCTRTRRSWPTSSRSRRRWRGPATAPRWASCCSSSPCPGCPTSTRATSCCRSRSSTPTTAGRSTGSAAARCSTRSAAAPRRPRRRASCG